jgi:hypothetical protein
LIIRQAELHIVAGHDPSHSHSTFEGVAKRAHSVPDPQWRSSACRRVRAGVGISRSGYSPSAGVMSPRRTGSGSVTAGSHGYPLDLKRQL